MVRVLDECGETWEETEDIGDAAVLVDAAQQRGRVHHGVLSGFSSSSSSLLQAAWFQARVEKKEGGRGIDGHFPSGADSDPRWSDDLACHASKSGKNVKIFSLPC